MFVFDNSIQKLFRSLFFLFVIAKICIICCRLINAAVASDDLMVLSPSQCQMTTRNYILHVYLVYTNF